MTEQSGEIVAKAGEILPSQCWPIKTDCEHGIEISFSARNFKDACVENNSYDVMAHYEGIYTVLCVQSNEKTVLNRSYLLVNLIGNLNTFTFRTTPRGPLQIAFNYLTSLPEIPYKI